MAIPQYKLNDFLPGSIQDSVERQYIGQGQDSVAVEGSYLAPNKGRIKALTMSVDVAATLELYINGQPQFVSGNPTVNLQTYDNPRYYYYQRGDVIKVAKTAGAGVGTVALDTESYELIKREEVAPTPGRQRFTRSAERSRLLVEPSLKHILQEKWNSFREATSQSQDRAQVTSSGADRYSGITPGGEGIKSLYGQGHFESGTGAGTKPTSPKPGGSKPGSSKPGSSNRFDRF